ncbi:expressed unknown protein [Seminavis robusta]|uniref:Uncharacterized protein n=1 Tax=Seminavis robusta TaxID=568900 RepID=A0A9N8HC70_9STRA|nr:expressed unknown protein [Seminavis robusta]|eukprot:Sro209_g087250.1 n/a (522) ;mRNA; r:7089-8654
MMFEASLTRSHPWLASILLPLAIICYVLPKIKAFRRFLVWLIKNSGVRFTRTSTTTVLVHPRNVKGESRYALTAMDCLQASIPPIAFGLFYDQPIDDYRFQIALEQTLDHFPLLAGRLIRNSENLDQAPMVVRVNPSEGGAHLAISHTTRPYSRKDDPRWFPSSTGAPFPAPHEPFLDYGPLLKIKVTHVESNHSAVVSFGFCHAVMDATTVGSFLETLTAHYKQFGVNDPAKALAHQMVPSMKLDRVLPPQEENAEPLERFTTSKLIWSLPKLVIASTLTKTINLTVEKSELQRLKGEFMQAASGSDLPWVSTYEMLGVLLLRAFTRVSKKLDGTHHYKNIECRCVVDPRTRQANPHATFTHPGNVSEMPSIQLPLEHLLHPEWQSRGLQEFHSQLRASLVDSSKMTEIYRRANASLRNGDLHTTGGRTMSSLLFARNILETNVTSYNSWLHMDWLGSMTTFGDAAPHHFQVTPGMCCVDMFWVFPRTPTQVTIRTTLPRGKGRLFLQELTRMNIAYQVQ